MADEPAVVTPDILAGKPWYMTSEAWVMIITQVIGLLALTGKITSAQADTLTKAAVAIAGAIVSAVSAFGYMQNRTQIKQLRTSLVAQQQQIAQQQNAGMHDPLMMATHSGVTSAAASAIKQAGL